MAKSKSRRKYKKLLTAGLVLVILIVAFVVLQLTHTTHFFSKPMQPTKAITKVGTPSATPKDNVSGSQPTTAQKNPSSTNSSPEGGVTSTNGQSTTTSPSQWTTSQSGEITVKQPIANGTLQSGDVLSGSATVSQVSFTLIDNDVGVIAQGTLNVVNGNFSGALQFTPKASSGRLDVYSTNAYGVEYNQVQISVNF